MTPANVRLMTNLTNNLVAFITVLICLLIQSCAVIPDKERALENIAPQQKLEIVGAKDALPAAKVDKALQKLSPDEQIRVALENHLKIEQSISDSHLFADNAFTLLFNGESTFSKMKELIGRAFSILPVQSFWHPPCPL